MLWLGPVWYLAALVWMPTVLGELASAPRVNLSFKELVQSGTARPLNFLLDSGGFRLLHLDPDQERLYVGARDYLLALDLQNINREPLLIHWPAPAFRQDECRMAGKGRDNECSNFVRLIEPWNRTHLYVCGTGAFHPVCSFVYRGWRSEEYIFRMVTGRTESGKGKCPFDPRDESMAALVNGNLYAGVHVDFMGMDAAVFRSLGDRPAIRTEQHDSRWLNDPIFIHARMIPDSADSTDDKVYFFFREKSMEAGSRQIYSRIGRVCLNDSGGQRSLVNKWTSFLKARLVCGVAGADGVETTFDELTDVFIQPTQDKKNPRVYGVFSTSGSVFRGSAVCVYSLSDVRTVFNGPFAHREGRHFQWGPYTGRVPYPRPGACAGGAFTPSVRTSKDYRDGFLHFVRSHPLMYNAVQPTHGRPLVLRTGTAYRFTALAVDRVDAVDGRYEVLFLGTDLGTVQKVVVLTDSKGKMEEVTLEEVQVFRTPAAVKDIQISSKRQLYVSSEVGVTQLSLHRCGHYGRGCADCCLARDPYCAWDGRACSRYSPAAKRRSRRQDVRNGDPVRQCQGFHMKVGRLDSNTVQFGVEGSSTFLECRPRSPRATTKWLVERPSASRRKLLGREPRLLRTELGLLLRSLELRDSAVYHCIATENGFSQTVARLELRVLERAAVEPELPGPGPFHPAAAAVASSPDPGRRPSDGSAIELLCQDYWRGPRSPARPKRNTDGGARG
ncbi:semaphorin-3F-like isoform X2 [Mobula hypostoma]|uniref:semaphorin-3F-like isoform X2 n=1 Tax=Mobula hypostoma TaxID=723540 RepID=UPI002FC28C0C